ncbi:MAG: DUF1416 domain-containing protein, partial [Caldilineaceae bacterium]|nr:DUF1416 domain-containing protein [Caldilineaceae bacterium]
MANEHENPEQQTDGQNKDKRAQQRPVEKVASGPPTEQVDVYGKEESKESGCGELQVLAFGYLASDEKGAYQEEYQGLRGIEVQISGPSGTFTQFTNADGMAIWADLQPGDYKVAMESPADRHVNGAYCSMRGSFANGVEVDHPVGAQVQNSTVTMVAIGLAPKPARLALSAIYVNSDGEPNPIPAELELFQSDKRIGCFQIDQRHEVSINRPGLIAIRPRPYQRGGCTYYPETDEIMLLATSGELCGDFEVRYTVRLGVIEVDTCLLDAQGKRRRQPLSGAMIELRRGAFAGGPPLRQAKTGIYPIRFEDLEPGLYSLSLAHSPQLNNQQLDVVAPTNGRTSVQLMSAQTIPVDFCFQPCRARLQGMVLDNSCGDALVGVPLLLRDPTDFSILDKAVTNAMGAYEFANVEPGAYLVTLAGDEVTLADGSNWEVTDSANQQQVTVTGSGATTVETLKLTREVHMIQGLVRTDDGEPIGNAVVQILDTSGNLITLVNADGDGRYSWLAPNAGIYYVEAAQSAGGPLKRFQALVNSVANVDVIVEPARSQSARRISGGQNAINEVTAFPFLTEEVDSGATGRRGTAGGSTSSTLVQNTFRDVLGWRVKGSDHKGFLTALGQSFSSETTDEQTTWRWTPRSYTVQVESGAITGAQASIYTRAKNALDQSLPLLEGLTSLGTDTDTEEELALRAIIESEFTELVNELGYEGGPRIQRVETLFTQ